MENASQATLLLLLDEGHEHARLDFKAMFAAEDKDAWIEIAKDVGAMQIDGGHIVLGAADDGKPSGLLTAAQAKLLDESVVRSKLRRWLAEPFDVRSAAYSIDGAWVAVIYVAPHPDGFGVFKLDSGDGPRPVFRHGEVFARHGSASERWQQADVDRIKKNLRRRADEETRRHVMEIAIPKSRQVAGQLAGMLGDLKQITSIDIDPDAATDDQIARLCAAASLHGRGNLMQRWDPAGNHHYATVLQNLVHWRARSASLYDEIVPLFPFLDGQHIRLLNDVARCSYFGLLDNVAPLSDQVRNASLGIFADPICGYASRARALRGYVDSIASASSAHASNSTVVKFGSRAQAPRLFAYPNAGHEDESLEETIEHYLSDSLAREGLAEAQVAARCSAADCEATFTGLSSDQAAATQARYQTFFDNGAVGLADADAFAASGKMDPAWKFLLPLGVPIAYAAAVEIMDFPPLTLIQNQDYLKSKTTARWWELLGLNGVATADLARFSCILDIAPVAAPASDGAKLDASGIYAGSFDAYCWAQLELMSRTDVPSVRRPLIALGLPIRAWIQRLWGKPMAILDVDTLPLRSGGTCPAIASNHPSFFYYAVHSNTGPDAARKNLAAGLAVMRQDVVAAAWHAQMGRAPSGDPVSVMAECQAKWQGRDEELLALVKKQAGIPALFALESAETPAAIRALEPNREELASLERQFYAARNQGHMGDER